MVLEIGALLGEAGKLVPGAKFWSVMTCGKTKNAHGLHSGQAIVVLWLCLIRSGWACDCAGLDPV
jgi:hypothetical protein